MEKNQTWLICIGGGLRVIMLTCLSLSVSYRPPGWACSFTPHLYMYDAPFIYVKIITNTTERKMIGQAKSNIHHNNGLQFKYKDNK